MNASTPCECPECGFSPCISFCPRLDSAQAEREWDADHFATGDARRCPVHPTVKTSSDDGMHDCECHLCEAALDEADRADDEAALTPEERALAAEATRRWETAREARQAFESANGEIPF